SPFSKFELEGKKTHKELQRLCTANIKNIIGTTTYTQMLNKDGGIEADVTVACISNNVFRVIGPAATRERDKFHIKKNLSNEVQLRDITDDYCCLGLFGPKSRSLISKISTENYSNESFRFGTGKFVNFAGFSVWVQRLSYVGELGFELYFETKHGKKIYQMIIKEGKNHNLSHCGMHAMDIMRMESGFLHWGHDISPEENQYEAGLNFAISYKKGIDFIGKSALLEIKKKQQSKRLVMLSSREAKPGDPLMLHFEPIYLEDKIIGHTTSGNYSFNYKKNISFGYINTKFTNEEIKNKNLYIEIEKKKHRVILEFNPLKKKVFF
ncbi:aminomethyltransferase family protein, partial [Candidatus Pelagibacter sp.]